MASEFIDIINAVVEGRAVRLHMQISSRRHRLPLCRGLWSGVFWIDMWIIFRPTNIESSEDINHERYISP